MGRGATTRSWIKLYVKGWLHGSIRYQLSAAERGTFADLLSLAGECDRGGEISDNDGKPFPFSFIAGQLHITEELLSNTIGKCVAEGRIREKNGVIEIINFNAYQSEYQRQKPYRQQKDGLESFQKYKQKLVGTYPELDIKEEWERCQIWYRDNKKAIKSPSLALGNWCKKAMEIRKEKRDKKDGAHRGDTTKSRTQILEESVGRPLD